LFFGVVANSGNYSDFGCQSLRLAVPDPESECCHRDQLQPLVAPQDWQTWQAPARCILTPHS
jgi:hypothetical protein